MIDSRGFVLFMLFLPCAARRNIRSGDSAYDSQQQTNTLTKAHEVSAKVREAFHPGVPLKSLFRDGSPPAGALHTADGQGRHLHAAPWRRISSFPKSMVGQDDRRAEHVEPDRVVPPTSEQAISLTPPETAALRNFTQKAVAQLQDLIGEPRTLSAPELLKIDDELHALVQSRRVDPALSYVISQNIRHARHVEDDGREELMVHLLTRLEEDIEQAAISEWPAMALVQELLQLDEAAMKERLRRHFDLSRFSIRTDLPELAQTLKVAVYNLEILDASLAKVTGLQLDPEEVEATVVGLHRVANVARTVLREMHGEEAVTAFSAEMDTTSSRMTDVAPSTGRAAPAKMQFFGGKSAEEVLEEKGYWPGEWVCGDCGYIYEPGTSPPFEELRTRWKCPQCAAPRRRFVKKAGNVVGTVDDTPLLIGTLVAATVIIALVYVGLTV